MPEAELIFFFNSQSRPSLTPVGGVTVAMESGPAVTESGMV